MYPRDRAPKRCRSAGTGAHPVCFLHEQTQPDRNQYRQDHALTTRVTGCHINLNDCRNTAQPRPPRHEFPYQGRDVTTPRLYAAPACSTCQPPSCPTGLHRLNRSATRRLMHRRSTIPQRRESANLSPTRRQSQQPDSQPDLLQRSKW